MRKRRARAAEPRWCVRRARADLLGLGVFLATVVGTSDGLSQSTRTVAVAGPLGLSYVPEKAHLETALPIFLTDDGLNNPKRARLHYLPGAGVRFEEIEMEPRDLTLTEEGVAPRTIHGFAATIPCGDMTMTGTLRVFAVVEGANGEEIARAGSDREPIEIEVVRNLDGEPLSFPWEKSPKRCPFECSMPIGFEESLVEWKTGPEPQVRTEPPRAGCASCAVAEASDAGAGTAPGLAFLLLAASRLQLRLSRRGVR